ncbi:MAG: tetratricopeptide repeat protein [Pseudochelatococcus sp.]|jgi:TPR repeat protein|uniref:tetratricopeptide repeat protein n=1 Tax=Pseudochelatococcus sp. TaxID=2020869 RepID=UPI003D9380A1
MLSLPARAEDAAHAALTQVGTIGVPNPIEAANPLKPESGFKSVGDAFRSGIRDYNAGDKAGAVRALQYAAMQGHTVSLWKLGRMFAEGDGVDHDDLKAFEYFSQIADRYADESPGTRQAPFVSSAFVALGGYFLEGIAGSYVKPDISRAVDMFQYAASYYGDPDGQYALARLYLEGQGVPKDARQGARWLKLAAEKGHRQAQALLGNLLIMGQGVPRHPGLGLMWLTLARDASDADKDAWITELHDKNFAAASEAERKQALSYLEQYIRKKQ